jgi:hypothetical protein
MRFAFLELRQMVWLLVSLRQHTQHQGSVTYHSLAFILVSTFFKHDDLSL